MVTNNPPTLDVIIPTYDNFNQLTQTVMSLLAHSDKYPLNIIIVNNGKIQLDNEFKESKNVKIIACKENLGWIGGLREGLKHSNSKYVLFANDDIYIPLSSRTCIKNMIREMEIQPFLGAVGPTSNIVMGKQNIWFMTPAYKFHVAYLIGFFMMVRREALDKAGGVQDMEFGGDDLDLSIRIRKAGYNLLVMRNEFVYHHGFQTGVKVHGSSTKPNGWNSREMTDNVNMELIRKHGFMVWRDMIWGSITDEEKERIYIEETDEGQVVRKWVTGDIVLELGCGDTKTVPHAIGVDRVTNGEEVPYLGTERRSVADVICDVTKKLPFDDDYADCIIARHVLEHCLDLPTTIKEWYRCLKKGGRLIISVPDNDAIDGISCNPEHLHAFNPESFVNFLEALGYKVIGKEEKYNNIGFAAIVEKI